MFQFTLKDDKGRSPVELFLRVGVDNEGIEMKDVTHNYPGKFLDNCYSSHYIKSRDAVICLQDRNIRIPVICDLLYKCDY